MTTTKNPHQIAQETMDRHYGIGSMWEAPNDFDESGFTRAQAESNIGEADIVALIAEAIEADRAQWFDTASSASRQHFIDTGRYLLHDGSSELDEIECGHNNESLVDGRLVRCDDCGTTWLTTVDLDQITARLTATGHETWSVLKDEDDRVIGVGVDAIDASVFEDRHVGAADAEFIAHAHQDVGALIAEVRRLRAADTHDGATASVDREQVARLVDPDAWLSETDFVREYGGHPDGSPYSQPSRRDASIKTAGKVLALIRSGVTV